MKAVHIQGLDFRLTRGSAVVVVGLQLLIINNLTVESRWLAPVLELVLLIPLSIATAWTQGVDRRPKPALIISLNKQGQQLSWAGQPTDRRKGQVLSTTKADEPTATPAR